MEGYGYPYAPPFSPARPPEAEYPDHGDGFGEYYSPGTLNEERDRSRRSRSKQRVRKHKDGKHSSRSTSLRVKSRSRSRTRSKSRSKSRSRSRTISRTRSGSRSRTRSRSRSRSQSGSHSAGTTRPREVTYKEPGFLDAFRVLYLTPEYRLSIGHAPYNDESTMRCCRSDACRRTFTKNWQCKQGSNQYTHTCTFTTKATNVAHLKETELASSSKQPSKFLATRKRQDRIQEMLKSDGFGSKRWLFYPRVKNKTDSTAGPVAGTRDNVDQRVKVDADFFRKYKKNRKIDSDAPINKLKRWELIFYKKLGFVQAI